MKLSLGKALACRAPSDLVELHGVWVGGCPPRGRAALGAALREAMAAPATAARVRNRLDRAGATVLGILLEADGSMPAVELRQAAIREGIPAGAVRAALAELEALGLAMRLVERPEGDGGQTWAVPREVAAALRRAGLERPSPVALLTLHGHLVRHFRRREGGEELRAAEQARRMYRFLAAEQAVCDRLERLPEELRAPVREIVVGLGGLCPVAELGAFGLDPEAAGDYRQVLEEASLGTVGELDLERFGIRQRGPVLVLFNEVVLAWLRHEARARPAEPAAVASLGVDFVSDFGRFASFIGDQTVRFTVRGQIFKSTGRRIAESLLPNPGREFRRREILDLLYRFALDWRFIDRTGERAFQLTEAGKEFLRLPLQEKQRRMLDWLIEDRELPGDLAHQLRLRRTALRYLKRLEPEVWYDAMFLPFVARNHYLATLEADSGGGESASFPVRSSADLRSLAWNLFTWIRKHLYLLGVVDMGYDEAGRAVAIRLTALGAELLGMIPGRELEGAGHVVVNPDFEVVLFPEERSHTLVYLLDRFCQREMTDSLYHYRITPASLHRALSEGMGLDEVLDLLHRLSRTPLPQNVLYSLESWARSEGMVTYHPDGRLVCDSPEVLDKLQLHPELGRVGLEREGPGILRLGAPVPREDLECWVRSFGVALRIAS